MTPKPAKPCLACGKPLPVGQGRKYCGPVSCAPRKRPAPAVYRYVAPDGRSYVGSISDVRVRDRAGLARSNEWIDKALATYPLETWRFEILERLPVGGMTRCAIYYADDLMRIATRART